MYGTGIDIATSDGIPCRKPGTSNTGTLRPVTHPQKGASSQMPDKPEEIHLPCPILLFL
jgi:hypothetical protein